MKKNEKEVYNVPIYIEKIIKKLNKMREKEDELLLQVNDYIRFSGLPKDVPFELLKHIPDDNVISGQTKLEV